MTSLVLALVVVAACGSAVVRPTAAVAATDSATSGPISANQFEADPVRPVGDLVVQRLALARPVAASKWLSGSPIADPAREQAVIDAGVARARTEGVDPALVERVLRDQIAASKLVQRGLFTRWTHDPWSAPTTAPDLAAIRAEITQTDDDLVDALGPVASVATEPRCAHVVVEERHRVAPVLDPLDRKALHVAWSHFCGAEPAAS